MTDDTTTSRPAAPASGATALGDTAGDTDTRVLPPVRHWPTLELTAADFDPVLTELMREGPLTRITLANGQGWAWLATGYQEVKAVTNDPRFSRAAVLGHDVTRVAPHFIPAPDAVGFADPPDHSRLRRVIAPAFSTRGVQAVRRRSAEALNGLVDAMVAGGPPADLTERVLRPFPIHVICELLGVPEEDREQMQTWTRLILSSAHGAQASDRAKDAMGAYFAELFRQRRASADEDVASLLGSAVGRGQMTMKEATGLAVLIQIGGEAVTKNSGQCFYLLLTRPDLTERLRAQPGDRPRAVAELLRYVPHRVAVGLSRIATEDVEISGVRIRAGEAVYVSYLAANRDPDVFPEPDRIDFDRGTNPHLSFGHGPHYCPGSVLSRMETELLVDTLLDRLPTLRLAVPAHEVRWLRGALIRGPEALPVAW